MGLVVGFFICIFLVLLEVTLGHVGGRVVFILIWLFSGWYSWRMTTGDVKAKYLSRGEWFILPFWMLVGIPGFAAVAQYHRLVPLFPKHKSFKEIM